MTDVVKDISDYMNVQSGEFFSWMVRPSESGGYGTLFMLDMPDSPDRAAAVYRYAGGRPRQTFGNPLHTRYPRVQVKIRDPKAKFTLDCADALIELFSKIRDQKINDTVYAQIAAVGEATELGPDPSGRQQASVNFEVMYYG